MWTERNYRRLRRRERLRAVLSQWPLVVLAVAMVLLAWASLGAML